MLKFFGWRGSGKTSSLVHCALREAQKGKKILIVTPNKAEIVNSTLMEQSGFTHVENIYITDIKEGLSEDLSKYDMVFVDEASSCLNILFQDKVKAVTDSINQDYIGKEL